MKPEGLLLVALGVFCVCGAVLNWGFFMNHRKARFLANFLGYNGARIFYTLLGSGLVVGGVLLTLGLLPAAK